MNYVPSTPKERTRRLAIVLAAAKHWRRSDPALVELNGRVRLVYWPVNHKASVAHQLGLTPVAWAREEVLWEGQSVAEIEAYLRSAQP